MKITASQSKMECRMY